VGSVVLFGFFYFLTFTPTITELRLLAQSAKLFEKRRQTLKNIPRFWPTAFANHADLEALTQHREDVLVLGNLSDVWVERDPNEPRAYTIEFVCLRHAFSFRYVPQYNGSLIWRLRAHTFFLAFH
jgi:hypothetical protein